MRNGNSSGKFIEAMVVTIAVVSVLMFATWQLASRNGSPETDELQKDIAFLASELDSITRRLQGAQARQIVLQRETDVLRRANRLLREQESGRQAELNRLTSELDFYRRLAGTGGAQEGLDIYHAEINATDSPRVFQFMLTLTQNIRRADIISGRIRIDVEGTRNDRLLSLRWNQLADGDTPEPRFRFKYFQQLEGYLALPENFTPLRLKIRLESGTQRNPVLRSYEWKDLQNGTGPGSASSTG
jgi:hypothetical protein